MQRRIDVSRIVMTLASLAIGAIGVAAWAAFVEGEQLHAFLLRYAGDYQPFYQRSAGEDWVDQMHLLVRVLAGVMATGALIGLVFIWLPRPWARTPVRIALAIATICGAAAVVVGAYHARFVGAYVNRHNQLCAMLNQPDSRIILDAKAYFTFQLAHVVPGLLFTLVCVALLLATFGSAYIRWCGGAATWPTFADRIFENVRTHGEDPGLRKSLYSVVAVIVAIVVLPILLSMLRGCADPMPPYRLPKGEGSPKIEMKVVEKKQERKLLLNPNSPVRFDFPELEDSEIEKIIDKETRRQYEADPDALAGALGAGKGGKGGWPEGFEDGMIRFIRLKHGDRAWADGMGPKGGNADENFLAWFKLKSGANFPVAKKGEAYGASGLRGLPPGQFPPFLYITGNDGVGMSDSDTELVREYLLEQGGTLLIDLGGPRFDGGVRNWVTRSLLPGKQWKVIAVDDPIYRYPFNFPKGPPLGWYHISDPTPMGIKHGKRWVVYFYRGDLNDAWKTVNMTGYPDRAEQAFRLGTNIVYHAIMHYVEINREHLMKAK